MSVPSQRSGTTSTTGVIRCAACADHLARIEKLEKALRMFPCQCQTAGDGKGPNRLVAQCLRCGVLYSAAAAPSEETTDDR